MRIAIGSDHRGCTLKADVMKILAEEGYEYQDFGCYTEDSVDYPDIAVRVGGAVASGKAAYGILFCYSGQGMVMAANKVRRVRAALCTDITCARLARAHNDANVLVMPAGFMKYGTRMRNITNIFLRTEFEGGRHLRRVKKMKKYEDSAHSI